MIDVSDNQIDVQKESGVQLSKHKRRRLRREKYFEMIDNELVVENQLKNRIIHTINKDGMDFAPDGRPIKADWWQYMESRKKAEKHNALACLHIMEQSIRAIRPNHA